MCTSYNSPMLGKSVNYCIDRTTPDVPAEEGEPVAYFMHGTNGNATTWTKNDYASALEKLRNSGEVLPPMTFVSFDTSAYSFFSDHYKNGVLVENQAYETWFITEFVPYIESIYGVCDQRECRAMIGESMGGFGAFKTTLRHIDMFSAIAVNSPALPPFSVRAPLAKWELFFSHHLIGPIEGFLLIEIVRKLFPTEAIWDQNDPIQLTENYDSPYPYPALYFDMGGWDTYGFNVGYHILKSKLDAQNIPYETNYDPHAGHDMWKKHAIDSIRFLIAHVAQTAQPALSSR
jgi:S-formylglutathione hydrolase FrmB